MRKPLIAGNWKMHLTVSEAVALATAIAESTRDAADREVMIAPAFTALHAVAAAVKDSPLTLASQNVCWAEKGAFTGEVSPVMLKDIGCSMAIIGHSERRHIFAEGDSMINKRVQGAMQFGLVPIVCIGETLEEREKDQTFKILENQVKGGLAGVQLATGEEIVIAYEPVWAIGTGRTATVGQAQEVHAFVRELAADMYEKNIASQIRILYGGSVNPDNVDALMAQPDVDGALVGGAALKADSFSRIIHFR